ncbi:hypothetical protein O1M63_10865 [Streptomyces mirabilis]|nr:hypothetical protein [Streptomyces mirabilis]
MHRDHGTRLRCGTPVRRLCGAGGRVTEVELGDGTTLSADVVVLALGSTPATRWLTGSSLRLRDGWSATRCARPHPASTPPETSPPGTTRTSAPACGWNTA